MLVSNNNQLQSPHGTGKQASNAIMEMAADGWHRVNVDSNIKVTGSSSQVKVIQLGNLLSRMELVVKIKEEEETAGSMKGAIECLVLITIGQ